MTITTRQLIDAYAQMVQHRIEQGFKPYLLTFMFEQLHGSQASIARQMEREIERVYATVLPRIVRKPRSIDSWGRMPVWLGCPDFPVPKQEKNALRDVRLNNGRHNHIFALHPSVCRMREDLADHFDEQQSLYSGRGRKLFRLHTEPITHSPEKVVAYVYKSLQRSRISHDEIIILPRTNSELD